MATFTRIRAAAFVLAVGVLSACGGGSGEMTVSEIAESIDCTGVATIDPPQGSKSVAEVAACTKDGEEVIITTYESQASRDKMMRDDDIKDVAVLVDKGDRWTAYTIPGFDSDAEPEEADEEPEFTSTCDAAREAFLTGTDEEIEDALQELQADRSAPTVAREYADYYLHRDAGNPDRLEADKSLIRSACG